jgi:hypothetical protein
MPTEVQAVRSHIGHRNTATAVAAVAAAAAKATETAVAATSDVLDPTVRRPVLAADVAPPLAG